MIQTHSSSDTGVTVAGILWCKGLNSMPFSLSSTPPQSKTILWMSVLVSRSFASNLPECKKFPFKQDCVMWDHHLLKCFQLYELKWLWFNVPSSGLLKHWSMMRQCSTLCSTILNALAYCRWFNTLPFYINEVFKKIPKGNWRPCPWEKSIIDWDQDSRQHQMGTKDARSWAQGETWTPFVQGLGNGRVTWDCQLNLAATMGFLLQNRMAEI